MQFIKQNKIAVFSVITVLLCAATISSCSPRAYRIHQKIFHKRELARMGYTIQVGAFAHVENAARLTNVLKQRGIEATYFVARAGLYKVRFGNFSSKQRAKEKALALKSSGTIEEYYIVSPNDYTVSKKERYGVGYLREELIKTANSFIGVPYLWGGASPDTGFDCSGLTMTVYQLNGLNLPRSSQEQFNLGMPVEENELLQGDLVFFATSNGPQVSHVGIYVGDGQFIHAPGMGKTIRIDFMNSDYYAKRFLGGRSYL
jgi:cell wall-associated NlpC family hydrolase